MFRVLVIGAGHESISVMREQDMTVTDADLQRLAERLGAVLVARGSTVVLAESCTGGWIAKCLTDVPGSSAWFDRGLVTYTNAAKHELLHVPMTTLDEHGAVSAATVEAMVAGALTAAPGGDIAVATSGIAGPGGGTEDKPVGLVWLAWARRGHAPVARCVRLDGDRDQIRRATVRHALEGLIEEAEVPEIA